MKPLNLLLSILIIASISCSTDVELNDEWEDHTLIYGVLNQTEATHYIRVQKSFLGPANAYEMATEHDSIYYSTDITVKLERIQDGNTTATIPFEFTTEIPKDDGIFASNNHIVYKSDATLYADSEYRMVVEIPSLNKIVTSTTSLIDNFNIDSRTYNYFHFEVDFISNTNMFIEWTAPYYARLFKVVLEFNYAEINPTVDTVYKSIFWEQTPVKTLNTSGGENMQKDIVREDFFKFVGSSLNEIAAPTYRISGNINLIILAGSEDLDLYIELNKPASGVVQERPIFTNIENGYGLFTARYTRTMVGNELRNSSKDSLALGQFTSHLGFVESHLYPGN